MKPKQTRRHRKRTHSYQRGKGCYGFKALCHCLSKPGAEAPDAGSHEEVHAVPRACAQTRPDALSQDHPRWLQSVAFPAGLPAWRWGRHVCLMLGSRFGLVSFLPLSSIPWGGQLCHYHARLLNPLLMGS